MERLTTLNKLDLFTKIDSSFTRTSSAGGTVSLLTYFLIIILFAVKIWNFLNAEIIFHYSVDTDFDKKLNINVDITVATPCQNVGADIMDSTNKHGLYTYGKLKETNTNFKLSSSQQYRWDMIRQYNAFIREEHHKIHRLIWKPGFLQNPIATDDHDDSIRSFSDINFHVSRGEQTDSCRFHGTISVNKLSGNFHISAGKYLPLPIGHAHVSMIGSENAVNFSHRIEKLSFGNNVPFIVNTLDGIEKITTSNAQLYQYFLKVVLTDVATSTYQTELYQYSVTERDLVINHDAGAHGVPGIYFKYEIEGLKVTIREDQVAWWQFIVQLCAILGGILAMSGLINQVFTYIFDIITCKYIGDIDIVN